MDYNIYPLITAKTEFDAVLLANGDYPTHAIPTGILERAGMLVCCDGAAIPALANGLKPEAVIGDGDSLPADIRTQIGNRFLQIEEQDYNDLTKATRYALSRLQSEGIPSPRIAYLGATGKREDHTLGNISLMRYYVKEYGICPTLITDYGYFVAAQGHARFATRAGQQVSVFNLGCKEMQSQGLRWPVRPFEMMWQGTLNQAETEEVKIDADGDYLVYRTFERK